MRKIVAIIGCFHFLAVSTWAAGPADEAASYWPQWRGPHATGVATQGDPPVQWDDRKNVKWKIPIPGKGHASPIVWGDRIFILTAIETDKVGQSEEKEGPAPRTRRGPPTVKTKNLHKFAVLAISRQDGKILWQRTSCEELPHEGTHATGSWASNSPVTDGQYVYAHFGSRGLYCFDMEGNPQWDKDLGRMTVKLGFGEGSSPVLCGDAIVINWDHEGDSFIVALDKKTGREKWKVDRDEASSWATPLVVEADGKLQIITSATNRVRGYDPAGGDLLWECGGMTRNAIPSPVGAGDVVYVTSGFRGSALQAIRLSGARGDVSGSRAIVWTHNKDTPYVPSPLLYGGMLYLLKGNNGVLSCFNAETGDPHFSRQKLDGIQGVFASPVGAADRVYVVGRKGTTLVLKRGPKYEVLSSNRLDDDFTASPAIVGGEIYLRGHKALYCIANAP